MSESMVSRVRDYIRCQKEHHAKRNYEEEIHGLFRRHGIEGAESFAKAEPEQETTSPEGGIR